MIYWPESLIPSVDFNSEVKTSVIRSQMDSGRIRQRRRFSKSFLSFSVTWVLDDEEKDQFNSIYKHLLNNGADWFYLKLPLANGMQWKVVRFQADSFSFVHVQAMHWRITAKMETEDDSTKYTGSAVTTLLNIQSS